MAIITSYNLTNYISSAPQENKGKMLLKAARNPVAMIKKAAETNGNTSVVAAQFGNRSQLIKQNSIASENFERVLDGDVAAKADALQKLAALKEVNIDNMLRQARSLFPDDSDLYQVLREMLRRRQLTEIEKKKIAALLKQVEEEANPRDLKAGINCGLKARLFGQRHLELKPATLRATYRMFLVNEQRVVEEYKNWISCYGYPYRGLVLEFVESALVSDIDAQDPSCSSLEFGALLGRLGQLKVLRSGDCLFIKKLLSQGVIAGLDKSEQDWLILLFSILQVPEAVADHLNALLGDVFLLHGHNERSGIMQMIFRACSSLPHELFDSTESVQLLLEELLRLTSISFKHELREQRKTT